MLTKSVGEGLPYGEPVSVDFHFWNEGAVERRVGDKYEYDAAFCKFRRSPADSHWDKVVGWIPWKRDLHADYEVFLEEMYPHG